jgi:hypothetical protein
VNKKFMVQEDGAFGASLGDVFVLLLLCVSQIVTFFEESAQVVHEYLAIGRIDDSTFYEKKTRAIEKMDCGNNYLDKKRKSLYEIFFGEKLFSRNDFFIGLERDLSI